MEVTTRPYLSKQKGDAQMIQQNDLSEQGVSRFSQIFSTLFSTLKVGQLLRQAGIRKSYGFSCLTVFQALFQLVFQGRNLFRVLESDQAESMPRKDVFYRFLNEPRFNWRKFYQLLCAKIVGQFETLTSPQRVRVFIVDDSTMIRNRSKKVELLARIYDHVSHSFFKGFQLLTLGWSDGFSFAPLDFAVMSSPNKRNRYNETREGLDRRLCGSKRRLEASLHKPDVVTRMIDRALLAGHTADYLLMDSWFTNMPLVRKMLERGVHVIGRIKDVKQRYIHKGKSLGLSELRALIPKQRKTEILGSVRVKSESGEDLKIVFVRNRNKRKEWIAILTTDVTLDDKEIVRIYGMRWAIEPFHKMIKSHLKLGKEFEGRSYDMMISHTTIVFARYLILEWERRNNSDDRAFGGIFYLFCDEVKDIDLKTALQQLMVYVFSLISNMPDQKEIACQVLDWIGQLPNWIKALWPVSLCES
jgi:hypothetical protein